MSEIGKTTLESFEADKEALIEELIACLGKDVSKDFIMQKIAHLSILQQVLGKYVGSHEKLG